MGALFHRFRQPAVIGGIIGGILLARTLLGGIPLGNGKTLSETAFPDARWPTLSGLANLGLILFMFNRPPGTEPPVDPSE
jgi:Kef-type K+ transport system membrane component KefB